MPIVCQHTEGFTPHDSHDVNRFREESKRKAVSPCDKHNCRYVDARNRLIPRAERLAVEMTIAQVTRENRTGAVYDNTFARNFFAAMTKLAVDAGLQDPPPTGRSLWETRLN